jgi:hypothetical protein
MYIWILVDCYLMFFNLSFQNALCLSAKFLLLLALLVLFCLEMAYCVVHSHCPRVVLIGESCYKMVEYDESDKCLEHYFFFCIFTKIGCENNKIHCCYNNDNLVFYVYATCKSLLPFCILLHRCCF